MLGGGDQFQNERSSFVSCRIDPATWVSKTATLKLEETTTLMSRGPGPGSLTWKNMVAHHQQNHQPGATDWSWLCSWICQICFNFQVWLECMRVMG